jgi:hypothetical protein
MQSAANHPSVASSGVEDIPVFSVVIAYEDSMTGKQAKRAYEFLAANLSHEWQVTRQMWKFEVLGIPELREMAATDAAMASLIIVSSRGDQELPADARAWIEKSLGYKGDTVALVALFDRPPEQAEHARATQNYLARMAKRGHMEYFTWPEVGLGKETRLESMVLNRQWEATGETLVPLAALAPREASCACWGIND